MKIDKGIVAAILAPFFIALSIIVTKIAGRVAPPLVIAGLGALISLPFLLGISIASKTDLQIPKLLTELRTPFLKVLFTRAILGSGLIVAGFTMTSAIKSVLLLRLEPVFVFLWSMLFFKEKPRPKKVIALAFLLIGSAMVVAPNGALDGPNLGDALIVISLLFLSYSYIPTQEIVEKSNPAGLNILTNLLGGGALALVAFNIPDQPVHLTQRGVELITGYSITFSVIGCGLYFYAFKTLKPWIIASFLSLEVVFGSVLALVLLKETMSLFQILGAVIVLVATAWIAKLSYQYTHRAAISETTPD